MTGLDDSAGRAQQPVRLALALLVCIVIALVAAGALSAYRLYTEANHRYLDQAVPVYAATQDVLVQMLNEQTGVRGFVITGDPVTLAPYRLGLLREAADLERIAAHASSDPAIPAHLAAVRRQVLTLDRYFERQIAMVRSGPAGQRRAGARVIAAKPKFDRFRELALSLEADAGHVVQRARTEQRGTLLTSLAFLILAGIIAVALAVSLLRVVPRRLLRLYREEQEARREAEQGADASRALTHVHDAVLLLDGREGGAVRYWNPAAASMFGLAHGNGHSAELVATLDALHLADDHAAGPRPVTLDGRERWLTYAESPFEGGRVVVLRDVSDDQRLERLRSDFVATAAHELRTPLAAVYGAVRTLRREDQELPEELSAQFLEMIESESERLKLVMDQLLVSAQLDREDVRVDRQRVDAVGLCESVVSSAELRKPDEIELEVERPPVPVAVDADPERLRQVVANLVDNAIKYSPSGGRVGLRVFERSGFGVIDVADRGLGIPADEQQRIFEKFYRLDPSMTRGIGGSGLGLYISRELVEQMGGLLSVDSRLGEGSTFSVMLPLAETA